MKNFLRKKLDDIIVGIMATLVIGFVFFGLYYNSRSEKIADWEQTCRVFFVDKTSRMVKQTDLETKTEISARVALACEMGLVKKETVFIKFFENSVPDINDEILCKFAAWDEVNIGSIAGPGPITKHTEVKLIECKFSNGAKQ